MDEPRLPGLKFFIISMTGVMGFTFSALGPAMPLLRADLGIDRSAAGLHFTALAAGGLILGPFLDRIEYRLGRKKIFWFASWSLVCGGLMIGLGQHTPMTLAGALTAGLGGTGLLAIARSSIADLDRASVARSIVANDTSWSLGALLPGVVVASLVTLNLGWRPTFLIPLVMVSILFVRGSHQPFPQPTDDQPDATQGRGLPAAYWVFWAAFLPATAAEWSTTAWISEFMIDNHALSIELAALMVTVFLAAMFAGRAAGIRLASRFAPREMMNGALGLAAAGSLTVWLADRGWIGTAGLVVLGLGASLLAPMLITLSIQAARTRTQAAMARIALAASLGILSSPLALGLLADRVGIKSAFGIVPLLFVMCWLILIVGRRASAPRQSETAPYQEG